MIVHQENLRGPQGWHGSVVHSKIIGEQANPGLESAPRKPILSLGKRRFPYLWQFLTRS
jgi:hypothetical protein